MPDTFLSQKIGQNIYRVALRDGVEIDLHAGVVKNHAPCFQTCLGVSYQLPQAIYLGWPGQGSLFFETKPPGPRQGGHGGVEGSAGELRNLLRAPEHGHKVGVGKYPWLVVIDPADHRAAIPERHATVKYPEEAVDATRKIPVQGVFVRNMKGSTLRLAFEVLVGRRFLLAGT